MVSHWYSVRSTPVFSGSAAVNAAWYTPKTQKYSAAGSYAVSKLHLLSMKLSGNSTGNWRAQPLPEKKNLPLFLKCHYFQSMEGMRIKQQCLFNDTSNDVEQHREAACMLGHYFKCLGKTVYRKPFQAFVQTKLHLIAYQTKAFIWWAKQGKFREIREAVMGMRRGQQKKGWGGISSLLSIAPQVQVKGL